VLLIVRHGEGPIEHGPGVLAPLAPVQQKVARNEMVKGEYTLTQRARFDLHARVLSRRDYRFDAGADLAPIDLALGWGPMSDQAVLDRIDVRQSARWFHLRWEPPGPLPEDVAMGHSGNMHIIPASDAVLDQLRDIRHGHVVRLWGYLVDARREDGFFWNTSLSRDDTGGGSCELFYVEGVVLEQG
jgi:hypothetical protein